MRISPPVRFLVTVVVVWLGVRMALLIPSGAGHAPPGRADGVQSESRPSSHALEFANAANEIGVNTVVVRAPRHNRGILHGRLTPNRWPIEASLPLSIANIGQAHRPLLPVYSQRIRSAMHTGPATAPASQPQPLDPRIPPTAAISPNVSHWRFSAWLLARSGSGPVSLSRDSQLGGSQAGLRAQYGFTGSGDGELAVSARLSRPISTRDGEAALGLVLRPAAHVPVQMLLERRIAIETGGRDTWALGIAGGVDRARLPLGAEIDAYVQAGVVGAHSRDLYADAALAVSRPLWTRDRSVAVLGSGLWASAQTGAARLDIGPQARFVMPIEGAALRVSLSWRQRIAGNARPGSGPALTVATDF